MSRRQTAPAVPCEGADGRGCPQPGCPGDPFPMVISRPGEAPTVRTCCNWCWITERTAYPLPCSACGSISIHVRQFSRWWHLHTPNALRDFCGDCLRPLPGLCSVCTTKHVLSSELGWPGDCTCTSHDAAPRVAERAQLTFNL